MEERICIAYNEAAKKLAVIGSHPEKVAESLFGYFIDVENIFGYTDINPHRWYANSDATFRDLSKKDRKEVYRALNAFKKHRITEKEIVQACSDCWSIAFSFSRKTALADEGLGALAD